MSVLGSLTTRPAFFQRSRSATALSCLRLITLCAAALAFMGGCTTEQRARGVTAPSVPPSTDAQASGPLRGWQRVHLTHDDTAYDFPVYANHRLDGDLSRIREIVFVQHGILRNGDDYYAAGDALLRASGVDSATVLLLAPNFPADSDRQKGFTNIPLWRPGGPRNWAGGDASVSGPVRISSMRVYDDLLLKFTARTRTPALTRVVLAGHSAGAQFMQRYAALNAVDEVVRGRGIDLQYVIANPSSYLYFTNERPSNGAFKQPPAGECPDYDDYRYGLRNMIPYGQRHSGGALLRRYAARHVTYLLGTADNNPRHPELDKRCGAEEEGATRLERGRNYLRYERYLAGSQTPLNHGAYEVVGVGHDQARMLGSQCGARLLFGATDAGTAVCRAVQP